MPCMQSMAFYVGGRRHVLRVFAVFMAVNSIEADRASPIFDSSAGEAVKAIFAMACFPMCRAGDQLWVESDRLAVPWC